MKHVDWVTRLFNYLSERSDKPFSWGTNDCVKFATGAIEAMTGEDPSKDFPEYSTSLEAGRIMRDYGGLEAIVSKYYKEVPILQAQRGDLALVKDQPHSPTLGIVVGAVIWMPGEKGVVYVALQQAEKAWRVE